jgi:hypothetical protein
MKTASTPHMETTASASGAACIGADGEERSDRDDQCCDANGQREKVQL